MDPLPFYRRPIRIKTVLLILLTPIVAVGVPALLWLAWSARPLNIEGEFGVKTPTVPSPNAHDLYQQAHDQLRVVMPAQPPALVVDSRAGQEADEDPKQYPLAGKIKWLESKRQALAIFDRALQAQYLFPPVRTPQPRGHIEEPYWLSWLARFVTVECQVLAAQGHTDKAVDRALDLWKMSLDASRGANVIVALNAIKAEVWAHRALDGEIAHLNGPQAARAARRFEKLLETRVPARDILQEERDTMLFQMKLLLEAAVHSEKREKELEAALARGDTNFNLDYGPAPTLRGPVVNWVLRRRGHEYTRGMQTLFENAEAPWSRRQAMLPPALPAPVRSLVGVLGRFHYFYARSGARQQMTLARLAIHAYRKDKGVYPTMLNALVPTYLSRVPHDPFADGSSLRYRPDGKNYKLWSIGPDARDDNARPGLNPSARRPSAQYLVVEKSIGDIVANVNR